MDDLSPASTSLGKQKKGKKKKAVDLEGTDVSELNISVIVSVCLSFDCLV